MRFFKRGQPEPGTGGSSAREGRHERQNEMLGRYGRGRLQCGQTNA